MSKLIKINKLKLVLKYSYNFLLEQAYKLEIDVYDFGKDLTSNIILVNYSPPSLHLTKCYW